jgi:hypothetical protein
VNGIASISTANFSTSAENSSIYFNNTYPSTYALAKIGYGTDGQFYTGYLSFSTTAAANANVLIERMRINSAGNVLIGTTTDNGAKLQVNGNINAINPLSASLFTINNNSNNSFNISLIRSDSATMFSVDGHSGAGYLNSSAWSYGSDRRIKENINYIAKGLDKVLNLKPAKFDYINGTKNNIGWIAQDIQEVIPEAVTVLSETNDQLTLKSDFIIPYLVKAIQEQQSQIEELKLKLN